MQHKEAIYIVGAGISGLIAAYELEQKGYTPTIIEQSPSVGGRVKTLNDKGYDLDLGFQVLLSAYPLVTKYLDLEALELRRLEPGAYIYTAKRSYLIGDPLRNWKLLLPTLKANIGSIKDKLNILRLNQRLKSKTIEAIFESPETSTQEYLIKFGFSNKIIKCFFKPFFAGIFLETELSTSSRMFEFVYKMFGEGYATIPKRGIGAISTQLKDKLKHTEFIFNCKVKTVTNTHITTATNENKRHNGVIITGNAAALLPESKCREIAWKSCICLYFEVDQTNLPKDTIALVAQPGNYINNLYAYKDYHTGKTLLSVTIVKPCKLSHEGLITTVTNEIKNIAGCTRVTYIKHYPIPQALPDIQNLKMASPPKDFKITDNVFLAGDHLLNGSLNAAMASGALAVKSLLQQKNATGDVI